MWYPSLHLGLHGLRVLLPVLAAGLILVSGIDAHAQSASVVSGTVFDSSGAVIPQADVQLLNPAGITMAALRADDSGRFAFTGIPPGRYVLLAAARGFESSEQVVVLEPDRPVEVPVTLAAGRRSEEVVVTAAPGIPQSVDATSQSVNLIDAREIALRAKAVVAQVAAEEPGLYLQRTSPTLSGIFVRGFTGNKVNVFVDGVRYSTGAARGGINTFLNLIDQSFLSSVEVLRGPNSAQYGSDAIGGSLQFLTAAPSFTQSGRRVSGQFSVQAGTSDLSAGTSLTGTVSTPRFGLVATATGRGVSDLRTGGTVDSHNAVTRFLGLPSSLVVDDRLPGTSFSEYGGAVRFAWAPTRDGMLVGAYLRGQQDGGKRYDQLIGGDGNLVADLRDLTLDFGYLRYEHTLSGLFNRVSVGYSINSQREERVNQGGNGNPRAAINHEPERTTVHGVQATVSKFWTRHAMSFGGDVYFEHVDAPSFGVNPVTGVSSVRRPRVPDNSKFTQGGLFVQDVVDLVPGRLQGSGALRWGGASYRARASDSPIVNGAPLWPDDELSASSVTFRAGAVYTVTSGVQLAGSFSRGFRAPHITDLGTLGLTGSGFEVAAPDVAGLDATVGSTANSRAVSTGRPVEQLDSETSLTYEGGVRLRGGRYTANLTVFVNDIDDNIAKQALILPQGAVGTMLGDQTITAQTPNGAVFVPASTNPVLVRANFDTARVVGVEYNGSLDLTREWTLSALGTYLHSKDRETGLPPNIEGGTPPPEVYVILRYAPRSRGWWVEPYLHVAAAQSRLSSLDLEDRRTGAARSRTSIASFFTNGARARGLVGNGPDGVAGTADDVLLATGETLAQVQLRVLGPTLQANSLFTEVPGYTTVGVRGGWVFGRHEIIVDFENLGDENYRGPSWGLDAPGRGLFVRYAARF